MSQTVHASMYIEKKITRKVLKKIILISRKKCQEMLSLR